MANDVDSNVIEAYTDGSSFPGGGARPTIGGIGVFMGEGHTENMGRSIRHGKITNQTMELAAAHAGLQAIQRHTPTLPPPATTVIYTDSAYVMNCMTKWIMLWEANGWRTKNKKPVQNGETLRSMLPIVKEFGVVFVRVRAHESVASTIDIDRDTMKHVVGNREADRLASQAAAEGARSACYIQRGVCVNTEELLAD